MAIDFQETDSRKRDINNILQVLQNESINPNDIEKLQELESQVLQMQGFNNLNLYGMKWLDSEGTKYYVYSDKNNNTSVEAETVVSAIEQSKLEKPYKIMHVSRRLPSVLKEDQVAALEQDEDCAIDDKQEEIKAEE